MLRRFDDAAEETNWSGRYSWLEILSGGAEGTYILVLPHANWASLAPSRQSPQQVLEEALGRQESDALFETFNEAVDSVVSEIWQYRPDLSYLP